MSVDRTAVSSAVAPSRSRLSRFLVGAFTLALSIIGIVMWPRGLVLLVFISLIFIPLERFRGRDPVAIRRAGLATDLAYYCVAGLLVGLAASGAVLVIGHPLRDLLGPAVDGLATLPSTTRWAISFGVTIVAGYWGHRLAHQIPALWRMHAVHHSMTELDWLTAIRAHPLDTAFTSAMYAVPLYALGLQSAANSATIGQILFFGGFIQHSNIRVPLTGLRWVIPNPEWHSWHHAVDSVAWNHNYSLFPVIDVIFRTHYLPKGQERPTAYGCPEAVPNTGFLAQLVWPFTHRWTPSR